MRDVYEGPWSKPGNVSRPTVDFHAGLLDDETAQPVYAFSVTSERGCDKNARQQADIVFVSGVAQFLEDCGLTPSNFTRDVFDDNTDIVTWFVDAMKLAHAHQDMYEDEKVGM